MALPEPDSSSIACKELFLADRGCVGFLGAGMAIPPSVDWWHLVKDLTKKAGIDFKDDGKADYLLRVVDSCIAKDVVACNEVLAKRLPALTATTRTAIPTILNRFKLKAILTTNFDPWIYGQALRDRFYIRHTFPDLPLDKGLAGGIFYLHGFFDSRTGSSSIEKLVLGKSSFDKAYAESSLLPGFLLNAFVYEPIVFIGFNPLERNIRNILARSLEVQKALERPPAPRFILFPTGTPRLAEERLRKQKTLEDLNELEIRPVYYDGSIKGFAGIEDLLQSWANEGSIENRLPLVGPFDVN